MKAWSYVLDRFLLLYNDNGVVVGAGYTDIHVELPVLWLLDRRFRRRCRRRMGQCAAAHLPACHRRRGAGVRRLVRVRRGGPRAVRALLRQAQRAAVGSAVHPAEHRPHPRSLQPAADHGEAVSRGAGTDLPVAAGQQRHRQQHPAVGLAAADGHLRATAGDPHLLQVPRCRRRSLPHRRFLSAGDDRGARARALAAVGQRADLGQPASAVHPRQRRRHVPGHPEIHRRAAEFLPEGHSAGRRRAVPPSPSRASISARAPTAT